MESLNDQELKELLRAWTAPDPPVTLVDGIRRGGPSLGAKASAKAAGQPSSWWRWLFAGTIRVPVPVALAVALILSVWAYMQLPMRAPLETPEPTVSLADFQPVKQLEPRVVGEVK